MVIAHDTNGTSGVNKLARSASGRPTIITIPATHSAKGLAMSDTTGTYPKTKNDTGIVPTCAANVDASIP
jgi:hypothetical protein